LFCFGFVLVGVGEIEGTAEAIREVMMERRDMWDDMMESSSLLEVVDQYTGPFYLLVCLHCADLSVFYCFLCFFSLSVFCLLVFFQSCPMPRSKHLGPFCLAISV
jgi:hypothetical protein